MFKIKKNIDLNTLEKYGFKLGKDIPNNEKFIDVVEYREDYWLVPMDPDNPEEPYYAIEKYDFILWSIHILKDRTLCIEGCPESTFHISNIDSEHMFYILRKMIQDNIIEDDYNPDI